MSTAGDQFTIMYYFKALNKSSKKLPRRVSQYLHKKREFLFANAPPTGSDSEESEEEFAGDDEKAAESKALA